MGMSWGWERNQAAWAAFGLAVTLVVGYVAVVFVGPLLAALFLYYVSRPVHRRLEDVFDHPDVAVTATLLLYVVPLLAVVAYAGVVGIRALNDFLAAQDLSGLRSFVEPYLPLSRLTVDSFVQTLRNQPRQILESGVVQTLREQLPTLVQYAGSVFRTLLDLFVMITVAFYLLRDDDRLASWFARSFEYDSGAVAFARNVDDDLATIYFGNFVTILVTSGIAAVTYYVLDLVVPNSPGLGRPLLLGLLTGVATIVPAVGMKLVYVPVGVYLLGRALVGGAYPLWYPIAFFVVTVLVVDTFPDIYVRSYLSAASFHMGLVLLAYVLGTVVFGWYGLFLGPLVLVAFYHFARVVLPQLVRGRLVRVDAE